MCNPPNEIKTINTIAWLAPNGLISHGENELCLALTARDGKLDASIPLVYLSHLVPRLFILYTILIFNHVPIKHLPERNILPWQETHDFKSVQVSSTLKNYLEFCWLWFLVTFSVMIIIRGCTDGSWAQLKLMASLALITSFYIPVSKKNGAFSSVGSTCITLPELQLVGLKDLINPSPISHRPPWQ